ncbi:uncharacterized protein [Phaseolus vulgaris]|uniref:uncharacterized protein n=1 Tax=Phaseolus vulgaris TaxID=3885 RepID=UPI0035CB877C
MAKVKLKQERSSHSFHGRQTSPRHSSKDSSNAHDHGEESRRRRHRHHSNGGSHHREQRHHQETKPQVPFVKVPSFSGDSDPNFYIEWEAKCEHIFNTYEVEEDQKVKIATLEFVDYAMKWWHNLVTDVFYNKRPPVVSWNDLIECMHFRFVPPHFRKDLMLKLQLFQQGTLSVDAYFKELETLLLQVNLKESEEAMIARFFSGLRRDIQDVVELQEYSSLGSLVHLAMKVEAQIAKRNAFKNSLNDGYYNNSWKNKNSFSKLPSKDSSFKPKESRPSTSTPKSPIKSSSKKCFKCLGYGHIVSNCPSKRNMYVHNGIVVSEHDSDSPKHSSHSRTSSEHESESPLEGDLLVERHLLGQVILKSLSPREIHEDQILMKKKRESENVKSSKKSLLISSHVVQKEIVSQNPIFLAISRPLKLEKLEDSPHCLDNLVEEFHDVFQDPPKGLPPLTGIEHQIDLIPGSSLPNRPAYRTNPSETREIRQQVEELIAKGWVQDSMSPCAMPIILVPKKDGTWRTCSDCRAINNITIKYRHPIPRLDDLLDKLHGSQIFTKIDLKSGYNQIPCLCLTIRWMLDKYANLAKCMFALDHIEFLGFVVSIKGVHVDQSKVVAIQNWPTPTNVNDVRSFHGLASFYRRFVPNFGTIAAPLNDIVKKDVVFKWEEEQQHAFDVLKEKLTNAPILALPNFAKTFEIECDASSIGIGAVLLKEGHPTTYFSEKLKVNSTTSHSPFEVVYGFNPLTPLDLLPIPILDDVLCKDGDEKASFIKNLHNDIKLRIEKKVSKYDELANKRRKALLFDVGDWVWLHLRKDRFPTQRKYKLMPRGDGPFQVLNRINNNAYELDMPDTFLGSHTFNISDLTPFFVGLQNSGRTLSNSGSMMEIKIKKRKKTKMKMLKRLLAHHHFYLKGLQGANLRN